MPPPGAREHSMQFLERSGVPDRSFCRTPPAPPTERAGLTTTGKPSSPASRVSAADARTTWRGTLIPKAGAASSTRCLSQMVRTMSMPGQGMTAGASCPRWSSNARSAGSPMGRMIPAPSSGASAATWSANAPGWRRGSGTTAERPAESGNVRRVRDAVRPQVTTRHAGTGRASAPLRAPRARLHR